MRWSWFDINLALLSATGLSLRLAKVSVNGNIVIVLHREMNAIADTKTACTLCGCVEFPPAKRHDENDVQMTAVLCIT